MNVRTDYPIDRGLRLAALVLMFAGCDRTPQHQAPRTSAIRPRARDAAAAIDARSADSVRHDAGTFVDAALPEATRSERLPDVLTRCPSTFEARPDAGSPAFTLLAPGWRSDVLPSDQRLQPASDDTGPIAPFATRLGSVRTADGALHLVTIGFTIGGVEEIDCARIQVFDWSTRQLVSTGPVASTDGTSLAARTFFLRTDGPYAGAGLLVLVDAHDQVIRARYFDSPTVLAPSALRPFPGGDSFVVYLVADGMNFECPTITSLVALAPDGLRELVSVRAGMSSQEACPQLGIGDQPDEDSDAAVPQCRVRPPGGFRVITSSAQPTLEVTRVDPSQGDEDEDSETPWYERPGKFVRDVQRFDPAQGAFVPIASDQPRRVRLTPHVIRIH